MAGWPCTMLLTAAVHVVPLYAVPLIENEYTRGSLSSDSALRFGPRPRRW